MRRSLVSAVAAIALAVTSSSRALAQTASPIPLRIEQPKVVNGRASVELVNPGARTVVAWGVTTRVTYADGASRSQDVMTDGYEQSIRRYQDNPVLTPGGRYVLVMAVGPSTSTEAVTMSAAPTFVVFDDDTATGDERGLERLFAARALNERVWRQVSALLESAAARFADPMSALHDASAQLVAIDAADVRRSAAFNEVDRKITDALRSGRSDAASAGPRLQQLREEAAALRSVAAMHARRRF